MTDAVVTELPAEARRPRLEQRVLEQHAAAFQAEEMAGRRLATTALLTGIAVIAVWLFIQVGPPRVWFYQVILGLFALIFIANYSLSQSRFARPWQSYVLMSLAVALLAFTLVVPNPFVENWPTQTRLRYGNFVYMLAFLAPIALSYSPKLMIWAGLSAAAAWIAGVVWVTGLPGTMTWLNQPDLGRPMTSDELLAAYLDPRFVDLEARVQEVIVVLLMAGVLALVVWRSRRLVMRQISVARERANLARYFPPTVVDQLADLDDPLGEVRAQPVAVMFVDIVGFTQLAEHRDPHETVEILRDYHALVEREIFDHQGTLDKFLGDGVMATFGTPNSGPQDAVNALACAQAILERMARWNDERAARGQADIPVSIGIHYGEAVLGDIGSERRLEFAVLGDVVNVANRLEALTRTLACRLIVSQALVDAVHRQAGGRAEGLLADFRACEPQSLRGRAERVAVWTYSGPE
ncbi:MAG: adenylate/guanylate cyclase domain-containing protein [Alphaproteobacteria bacterium]|nr:adenylate/guanylate cyclase domain-containing protein [Alphaproteobacteria bacterium]